MAKSKVRSIKNKIIAFISVALIVVLVMVAVGFFAFFTNGFQGDFSRYYLTYKSKIFKLDNTESLELKKGNTYNFKVNNVFEKLDNEDIEYTVKIVAVTAAENNFVLRLEDGLRYYNDLNADYSEYFGLQTDGNNISFKVPSTFSLKNALNVYYGECIYNERAIDLRYVSYYSLIFNVPSKNFSITVPFTFYVETERVDIDHSGYVFYGLEK